MRAAACEWQPDSISFLQSITSRNPQTFLHHFANPRTFRRDAMKDALVLLVILLDVHAFKQVLSLPYHADSHKNCNNPDREYLLESLGLCCKKCPPGCRLKRECSGTSESVCEPCEREQYMENWNYAPNCFPCAKCKTHKGLQFAIACSPTIMSKCACRPGMYCIMESDEQHCTTCQPHTSCRAGYGVSVLGTAHSNVKCKRCPEGTFSNTSSATEPCRHHTSCHGRRVLRAGTTTSDTVCEPGPLPLTQTSGHRNQTTTTSPPSVVSGGTVDPFFGPATLEVSLSSSLTQKTGVDGELVAAVSGIVATVTFFIIVAIVLLVLYKTTWTKANCRPKDTANESHESGNEVETLRLSFAANSPGEQSSLLQCTELSCDSGHGGDDNDASSSHSSQESVGALHSTLALRQPQQSPSGSNVHLCPASAGPHVNVNITFNIGDRGSPSTPGDSVLRLGQEEESFSIPKQEAEKELPEQESME
ncbi:tumor necrosis factor receptor superfamily member 1B isoform X3 [Hippocampus comes]|uniref:tumor necrosis factor receptor superfamily member 1B isoform X3 n=1 Tax=Hippocampus comes TaxID=109280 RepID=UPI00094F07A1|nr:PREDICTED: tumor necrosis factor receptor superfamily member 1B-like isoform X3 [Hippocampus comes]